MFKDKTLLITGGTGSFGNAVLEYFLKSEVGEIRIFSRDEKKQEDLRIKYKDPKLNFIIGDVRDFGGLRVHHLQTGELGIIADFKFRSRPTVRTEK